jgi:hypothetical protein
MTYKLPNMACPENKFILLSLAGVRAAEAENCLPTLNL